MQRVQGPEETQKAGAALGATLKAGDIVCLYGDLGAGKTTFVKGIAAAFGLAARDVISASFTVIAQYPTAPPLYHIDLYRISSEDDLESTGFYDVLNSGGICVIEWAERIGLMGDDAIMVNLDIVSVAERDITIRRGFQAQAKTDTRLPALE